MKNKKYENFQDFIIAFDSTHEEIIKKTYDLLKLYNQTQQQLQTYKDKEDKIRELVEAPIDNMSLNWQSKLILAILNEGDK